MKYSVHGSLLFSFEGHVVSVWYNLNILRLVSITKYCTFFFSGSNCESLQQSWLVHYEGQYHQFFIINSQVVVPTETYQPVKWHWFLFHGCGKCHNIKWLACLSLILSWSVTNNYWIIIRLSMWYHADTRFDNS